jgi:hypothetical protein
MWLIFKMRFIMIGVNKIKTRNIWIGLALLLGTQFAWSACSTEPHKQFDFWLGTWKVTTPSGKLAGYNEIKKDLNDCVLIEQYRTNGGFKGQSLNIFDTQSQQWHQTWVDNSGTLLMLAGGIVDGAMIMSGREKHHKEFL